MSNLVRTFAPKFIGYENNLSLCFGIFNASYGGWGIADTG